MSVSCKVDVLATVFGFLSTRDTFAVAARVNKEWKRVVDRELLSLSHVSIRDQVLVPEHVWKQYHRFVQHLELEAPSASVIATLAKLFQTHAPTHLLSLSARFMSVQAIMAVFSGLPRALPVLRLTLDHVVHWSPEAGAAVRAIFPCASDLRVNHCVTYSDRALGDWKGLRSVELTHTSVGCQGLVDLLQCSPDMTDLSVDTIMQPAELPPFHAAVVEAPSMQRVKLLSRGYCLKRKR